MVPTVCGGGVGRGGFHLKFNTGVLYELEFQYHYGDVRDNMAVPWSSFLFSLLGSSVADTG